MAAIYYVYEHWRPDKDEPFYVGKGHGRRAWFDGRRNSYHQRILKKLASLGLCVEVRLIVGELDEDQAYAIERERIAYWRGQGIRLTNLTDGGEGLKNPSDEVRAKLSAKRRARPPRAPLSEERRAAEFKRRSEGQRGKKMPLDFGEKISAALTGKTLSDEHRAAISAGALTNGRSGRDIPSEEAREKMRVAKLGKTPPEEVRTKMAEGQRRAWVKRKERAAAVVVSS